MVTPSRIFLGFCLAILTGIALALGVSLNARSPFLLVGLGILLASFTFPGRASFGSRKYLPFAMGCLLVGLALGIWRVHQFEETLAQQTVAYFSGNVEAQGVVASYPEQTLHSVRFTLAVTAMNGKEAEGRVLVTVPHNVRPPEGSTVSVRGVLRTPQPFDGFNYPAYLAKDRITATISGTGVRILGQEGEGLSGVLYRTRMALEQRTLSILPFREGATLKAILLGDEGSMTKKFQEDLNRSGLRHIVAISGMNIAIIVSVLFRFGLAIGLWRTHAFLLALGTIVFFVSMIGFPASAIRAALMGVSLHVAPILGRPASALRAVIFSATIMTLLSPYVLFYDVGFQLSFMAVLGILYLEPPLRSLFRHFPNLFATTLATTFAAQIAVLPLLVSVFESVSLTAPLTNVLVVPPLWLVTILGFLAVFLASIWPIAGSALAFTIFPYLLYLQKITTVFAELPVAALALPTSYLLTAAFSWYAVLLFWVYRDHRRRHRPIDLFFLQQAP